MPPIKIPVQLELPFIGDLPVDERDIGRTTARALVVEQIQIHAQIVEESTKEIHRLQRMLQDL